jgi:hypothetical protein
MNRSRSFAAAALSLSLAAAGAVSSYGRVAVADDETVAPSEDGLTRAPIAPWTHGRIKRIGAALGQVGLRPEQRSSLEALATECEARRASVLAARTAVIEAFAAQVEAGALRRADLLPLLETFAATLNDVQDKDRASFETVHVILDPAQRGAFVDAMEAGHGHEREGETRDHTPGHYWEEALAMTAGQRAAFEQILRDAFASHGPERGAAFRGGHVLLEAFRGDDFSYDAVSPREDIGGHVAKMTGHLFDVTERVLPLLSDDQRAMAATKLREHADNLPLGPGF